MLEDGNVFSAETGALIGAASVTEYDASHMVKIVLTVAHLDHQPENNDRTNLRALCQRCHLTYDAAHHARNAAATRRGRRAAGDLFGGNHA